MTRCPVKGAAIAAGAAAGGVAGAAAANAWNDTSRAGANPANTG
jgi:hypothetical protein